MEAVRLEARAILGQPGEVAVAQEHRLGIPGGIVAGEILRRRAAGDRYLEQIEIGRPGLDETGNACREHQRVAIGAERIVRVVAEGLGRNVGVEGLGDIDRDAGFAIRAERRGEQVRTGAVTPGIPMPDEQPLEDTAIRLFLGARIEPVPRAGEQLAIGQDLHRHGEAVAGRRHLQRADLERVVRDLQALAAVERQSPDLRAAGARGQEVEVAAVRCPARAGIVGRILRQSARLRISCAQIQQPEVGAPLVCLDVGFTQHEGDIATVGGHLWVADPLEAHQILDGQRGLGACRRGGWRRKGGRGGCHGAE